MALSASDVLFKYSTSAGSAGNTNPQPSANASLGKFISTTIWPGGVLHDLFDILTGDENAASQVDYRCFFVHNSSVTNTWFSVFVWFASQVAGGANLAIGLDPTGVTALTAASAQALVIPSDTSAGALSAIVFSNPTTKTAGLAIGDIPPGYVQAIWVQRTATNSGPLNNDGGILNFQGDTSA